MREDDTQSDEHLVKRALENAEHYVDIVERYEMRLRRFLSRIAFSDPEEIEDVLQETFIRAWRNLRSFDSSFPFSAWIYRIARNTAISRYRRDRKHTESAALDGGEIMRIADATDVHTTTRNNELAESIEHAFSGLPDTLRETVYLALVDGYSYDEISDIMQCPPGTVATHIHRAKKLLQVSLCEFSHESETR